MKISTIVATFGVAVLCLASLNISQAVPTRKSGLPWNSGAFTQHSGTKMTEWSNWRGRPTDNVVVFPSRDNWSAMLNTWWYSSLPADFTSAEQDLVVTLPLWPKGNSLTNTGSDAQWRQIADQIEAKDPNAWVRLGWEMNIPSSYWSLNSANKLQWAESFNRAADLMKSAAPDLRFVYNPIRGNDQTCQVPAGTQSCSREVFQLVKDRVQAYGIDSYDAWNPLTPSDTSSYNQHFYAYGGLVESANYARENGKLFAVPEWGLGCNTSRCQWQGHAGGDNPIFIEHYLNFFYENRDNLAFESYYEEADPYIRSSLKITPIGPKAPLIYQTKIQAYGMR